MRKLWQADRPRPKLTESDFYSTGRRKSFMNRHEIYLEIVYRGLLDIRANCNDSEQVFAQSDHLHNMPHLLANLDNEELHDFYWNCMRPSYLGACNPERAKMFDDLWAQLEDLRASPEGETSS
jgi:hypothetical protein